MSLPPPGPGRFILIVLVLVLASPAGAADLRVEADGSGDYTAIQPALDAASFGDTVSVGPGTWTGLLTVRDKALTLRGRLGAEATVLDGNRGGRILTLTDSGGRVTVEGLTFTGGLLGGIEFPGNAGAALAALHSELTVTGCRFLANLITTGGSGGAIYATARIVPGLGPAGPPAPGAAAPPPPVLPTAEILITDSVFEDNLAGSDGGAVLVEDSEARVERCRFTRNRGVNGAGLYHLRRNLVVEDCTFLGNAARIDGGGMVYAGSEAVRISGTLFADNAAGEDNLGGGLAVLGGGDLTLQGSWFLRNRAVTGGGLWLASTTFQIEKTLFLANTASQRGGGADIEGSPSGTFLRCTWLGDSAADGAALNVHQGSVQLVRCLVGDTGAAAVTCPGAELVSFCNLGGPDTGGCATFDGRFEAAVCPSDSLALCRAPVLLPECGLVGHAEADCGDPACVTAVRPISWGALKQRYR